MEHSDDDAPEEISLLQAKEQNLNDRKAERLSKKALADKRKQDNVRKDAVLRENKFSKKNIFLPTEVLDEISQGISSSKKSKSKEKLKKTVSFKKSELRTVVKGGIILKKLRSEEGLISDSRKEASKDATDLLSRHFGAIQREDYFKVYSRDAGPSKRFTPT